MDSSLIASFAYVLAICSVTRALVNAERFSYILSNRRALGIFAATAPFVAIVAFLLVTIPMERFEMLPCVHLNESELSAVLPEPHTGTCVWFDVQKQTKPMNPIARVVRTIKPSVVASKKGKGSYRRQKEKANSNS